MATAIAQLFLRASAMAAAASFFALSAEIGVPYGTLAGAAGFCAKAAAVKARAARIRLRCMLSSSSRNRVAFEHFEVHTVGILHEDGKGAAAEIDNFLVLRDDAHAGCPHVRDGGLLLIDLNAHGGRAGVADS